MARSTLEDLVHRIRTMTVATVGAYTLGTANYWDDTQIMLLLDDHRQDIWHRELYMIPRYTPGGSAAYYEYDTLSRDLEKTDGGTAIFILEDSLGNDKATTDYTMNYQRGLVTFNADQRGTVYYASFRTYDLIGTAVDLLESWAANLKLQFDFTDQSQQMLRSQKMKQVLQLAERFRRITTVSSVQSYRSDTTPATFEDNTITYQRRHSRLHREDW